MTWWVVAFNNNWFRSEFNYTFVRKDFSYTFCVFVQFSSLHTGSLNVSYIFLQKSFYYSFHIFVHSHLYLCCYLCRTKWHSIFTSKSVYYTSWHHSVHLTYCGRRRVFYLLLGGKKNARHKKIVSLEYFCILKIINF